MDNFSCSPVDSVEQYIILLDHELMSLFVENPLIVSCGLKTRCRISITNRVLNRSVRPGFWNRYFIVSVVGADHFAIQRCNRLLERHIPEYRRRQRYRCKGHVTLYTNEWLPDNSPVCEAKMRMGPQRSKYGNLRIFSPYANHKFRNAWQTPWKIKTRENLGHYEIADLYRPLLAKAFVKDLPAPLYNNTTCADIELFNLPNVFDRYTTFRAVDNENINLPLQHKCLRYLRIMKTDISEPPALRRIMDERQSSIYLFGRNISQNPLINENTKAIDSRKTVYKHLDDPQKLGIMPLSKYTKSALQSFDTIKKQDVIVLKSEIPFNTVIVDDEVEDNKNSENSEENLIVDQNQNFIEINSPGISTNIIIGSTKLSEKKKRKVSKGIRLNRYIRLYCLKTKRKCINYKIINNSSKKVQDQLLSDVTWITSDFSSDFTISDNASRATNIADNTLDSMKCL